MKLTAKVKLILDQKQAQEMLCTLETVNSSCNFISEYIWENRKFNRNAIHKEMYRKIRDKFNLPAQVAVRCIAKVVDAYKKDKKAQREFHKNGSIAYDDRILKWYMEKQRVSIRTLTNRINVSYITGDYQSILLQNQKGESDLVYWKGEFYLYATCDVDEAQVIEYDDTIGADLGIVNILVDSDNNVYSGKAVNSVRIRNRNLRKNLQKKGTKSAKRLLRKRKRKEKNFAKDVNHCISKKIVVNAERTNRAITVENLEGIRERTRVRRSQRAAHHSWGFYQLKTFIQYKARRRGVKVIEVNPRNTSRACPECWHIAKKNRKSRDWFECVECGFSGPADYIAAVNIRRVSISTPYADRLSGLNCKPTALAVGN